MSSLGLRLSVRREDFPHSHEISELRVSAGRLRTLLEKHGVDKLVEELTEILGKASLPLGRHDLTEGQVRGFAQNLRGYTRHPWTTMQNYDLNLVRRSSCFGPPYLFDGRPHLLRYNPKKEYYLVDRFTDAFTEDVRLRARRALTPLSPLERWNDPDERRVIVRHAIQNFGTIHSHTLRESIFATGKEASTFKETLALSVFRLLRSRRILDFSAGWGARLAAAIVHGADRYVGCDPNQSLKRGHEELADFLGSAPGVVRIHYQPFEDVDLREERFDTVFSSPPYFDVECYEEENSGQSINRHPTMQGWIRDWLFPTLAKSWRHLVEGGCLAVHMCDTRFIEPMLLYIGSRLPGATYRGVLSCTGSQSKPRPIWVFEKRSIARPEIEDLLPTLYPELKVEPL